MHEQCLCDGVGKTADRFQSFHQKGGTLLVFSVVLPCLEGQLRLFSCPHCYVVTGRALIKGCFKRSQNQTKRCCLEMGRYRDTGTIDDMRPSGRPKFTTAVDGRYLRISARRNPESNAIMLNNAFCSATGRRDSTQIVRNRLHDVQLHSRRPWRGPHLTPRHHAAWYRRAQKQAEWTRQIWHQVLFTDECRTCLQSDKRRKRDWRQCGQARRLRHTVQQVQQGSGSLMFWDGIMWDRRTPLVVMEGAETAIRYRNDVLRPILQPYEQNFERNLS